MLAGGRNLVNLTENGGALKRVGVLERDVAIGFSGTYDGRKKG